MTEEEAPERDYEAEIANLQKKLGDQGNEIGQLRKVADHVLQTQVQQQEDDWDFDPVEKKVSGLESELVQMRQEQELRALEQKHPGFRDLPKDESFAGWVQGSAYRSNLYRKADAMDFSAADELFTAWEEQQQNANAAHTEQQNTRQQALKAASMEKGSSGGSRQQYFSRTELIDMRINNPTKYDSMRDEIMKAYAEGRVRK